MPESDLMFGLDDSSSARSTTYVVPDRTLRNCSVSKSADRRFLKGDKNVPIDKCSVR